MRSGRDMQHAWGDKKLIYDRSRKIWLQYILGKTERRWIILKLLLVRLGAKMWKEC